MDTRPPHHAQRAGTGTLLALLAAVLFGAALPLSRLLFDHGTNPLTVGALRYAALALCLVAWLAVRGNAHPRLTPRERAASVMVGLLFALISIGQLLAIARISVSLTTLVFYAYPALTVICVSILDRRPPRLIPVLGIAGASLGLVLVLGLDTQALDALGIALALMAAAAATASFLTIERFLAASDALRTTAVSALAATGASVLALLVLGDLALPETTRGNVLLLLVMLVFAGAVLATIAGVARAGSVRTALVLFLEPVVAIAIALLLLGERLTLLQWAGAVLVIAAVALSARR